MELVSRVVRANDVVTVASSDDANTTVDISSDSGIDEMVGGPGLGYHQVERVSRPPTTSFRSSDLRMRISGEEMSRRVQERRTAPPLPRRSLV